MPADKTGASYETFKTTPELEPWTPLGRKALVNILTGAFTPDGMFRYDVTLEDLNNVIGAMTDDVNARLYKGLKPKRSNSRFGIHPDIRGEEDDARGAS